MAYIALHLTTSASIDVPASAPESNHVRLQSTVFAAHHDRSMRSNPNSTLNAHNIFFVPGVPQEPEIPSAWQRIDARGAASDEARGEYNKSTNSQENIRNVDIHTVYTKL